MTHRGAPPGMSYIPHRFSKWPVSRVSNPPLPIFFDDDLSCCSVTAVITLTSSVQWRFAQPVQEFRKGSSETTPTWRFFIIIYRVYGSLQNGAAHYAMF